MNTVNTEFEHNIEGPDKDGDYCCKDCGHMFALCEGEPLECPICKQINEAPELLPCPFCGEDKATLDWEIRDRDMDDNHHQIQVRCMKCGAETDLFDTAAEAVARWNRRTRLGERKSRLKPCPFCAGNAVVDRFRDHELDLSCDAAYYHIALCSECGNRTRRSDDRYDVETTIDAWNARADPTNDFNDREGGA